MALEIHEPEVEMGGRQVIRVGNKDRPMSWVTFHFDSEADAIAAHEQLMSEADDGEEDLHTHPVSCSGRPC